jgi:hypothetical protein
VVIANSEKVGGILLLKRTRVVLFHAGSCSEKPPYRGNPLWLPVGSRHKALPLPNSGCLFLSMS